MELFRFTPEAQKFAETWHLAKAKSSGFDLQSMNDEMYSSKILGDMLYGANATDFSLRFDKEFFSDNFNNIIDAHESLGMFNTYDYLIKGALGQKTEVTFEVPKPGHLIINVAEIGGKTKTITHGGDDLLAKSQSGTKEDLLLKFTTSEYALNQVIKMIESINVAGVFIEIKFIRS